MIEVGTTPSLADNPNCSDWLDLSTDGRVLAFREILCRVLVGPDCFIHPAGERLGIIDLEQPG